MPEVLEQHELTRKELYDLVWSTPMRKLAGRFGLSDVGLAKTCERFNVPRPPRGYWTLRKLGKTLPQTPLPADEKLAGKRVDLALDPRPEPKPPAKQEVKPRVADPELAQLIAFEEDPANKISVPDSPRKLHPVVEQTKIAMKHDNRDQYNHVHPSYRHPFPTLEVAVTDGSVPRAIRLLDALAKAIESRGHRIEGKKRRDQEESSSAKIVVFEENFYLRVREKSKMVPAPPEPQSGPYKHLFQKGTEYLPTGIFELEIRNPHGYAAGTWVDKPSKPLEDRLNEMIIEMLVDIERRRNTRLRQQREEEERKRQEEIKLEEARRKKVLEERVEQLRQLARQWNDASTLRAFLTALRQTIEEQGGIDPSSETGQWLAWATDYVESLDPLRPGSRFPEFGDAERKVPAVQQPWFPPRWPR